jgi:hypothetical protein
MWWFLRWLWGEKNGPMEGFPDDVFDKKVEFTTVGNYCNAYRISIQPKTKTFQVKLWDEKYSDSTEKDRYVKVALPRTKYSRCFAGNDAGDPGAKGNTMLFELPNKSYIFIGDEIYAFRAKDRIEAYRSDMGNSSTPYPFAVGGKFVYLMLEHAVVPKSKLSNEVDPYVQFYANGKIGRVIKTRVIMHAPPWDRRVWSELVLSTDSNPLNHPFIAIRRGQSWTV